MTRHTLHHFSSLEDAPFDVGEYSRMKFGSVVAARHMGRALADDLYSKNRALLRGRDGLVIPSAYDYVQNAATLMTKYMLERLNHHLAMDGAQPFDYTLIHRKRGYSDDYGFLTAEQRAELMEKGQYFVNAEIMRDKLLILVDDVLITGSHERKLEKLLEQRGMDNERLYLYFAEYSGPDATIESRLNFADVVSPIDFVRICRERDHKFSVRPIKYLLSLPKTEARQVMRALSRETLAEAYAGAIAERYYQEPRYVENFMRLRRRTQAIDALRFGRQLRRVA